MLGSRVADSIRSRSEDPKLRRRCPAGAGWDSSEARAMPEAGPGRCSAIIDMFISFIFSLLTPPLSRLISESRLST